MKISRYLLSVGFVTVIMLIMMRKYKIKIKGCNTNHKLNHKIPIVFHNLKNYDSHLIIQELGKFNLKISVIPNGLEKYMSFTISNKLSFIDSCQVLH